MNEVKSFVKGGLRDLSVSRTSFEWGVKVLNNDKHIMYVWLDALTNYLSAIGYPDTLENEYVNFWPADIHMVGKDILRFHAVYWPAFLMAAELPLPKRIFAHGWWTNEGKKISKSEGNVIDPLEIISSYGLDQIRYFLLREVPFGSDGDFSKTALLARINGDLSNDLGNLCQRVISMIYKNCNGFIPRKCEKLNDRDIIFYNKSNALYEKVKNEIDKQSFHEAIKLIWAFISDANKYVDEQAPWKLRKTDERRMNDVLWILADTIRKIAIIVQPFMPDSSTKILDQLSIDISERNFSYLDSKHAIKTNKINSPSPIFPRIEE
jgi:methionyl-tRNA synthetase